MRLHLKLLTPTATLLQDQVDSVQVPSIDGVYELFPHHAPVFIALQAGEIVVRQSTEIEHWFIDNGICYLQDNNCTIMINNTLDLDELNKTDIASIETALKLNVDSNFSKETRNLLEAKLSYKHNHKNA